MNPLPLQQPIYDKKQRLKNWNDLLNPSGYKTINIRWNRIKNVLAVLGGIFFIGLILSATAVAIYQNSDDETQQGMFDFVIRIQHEISPDSLDLIVNKIEEMKFNRSAKNLNKTEVKK